MRLNPRILEVVHHSHEGRQNTGVLLLLQLRAEVSAHLSDSLASSPAHLWVPVLKTLGHRTNNEEAMLRQVWARLCHAKEAIAELKGLAKGSDIIVSPIMDSLTIFGTSCCSEYWWNRISSSGPVCNTKIRMRRLQILGHSCSVQHHHSRWRYHAAVSNKTGLQPSHSRCISWGKANSWRGEADP